VHEGSALRRHDHLGKSRPPMTEALRSSANSVCRASLTGTRGFPTPSAVRVMRSFGTATTRGRPLTTLSSAASRSPSTKSGLCDRNLYIGLGGLGRTGPVKMNRYIGSLPWPSAIYGVQNLKNPCLPTVTLNDNDSASCSLPATLPVHYYISRSRWSARCLTMQ
jgi:hypothetical protein